MKKGPEPMSFFPTSKLSLNAYKPFSDQATYKIDIDDKSDFVYEISCHNCPKVYVCETSRKFEHKTET